MKVTVGLRKLNIEDLALASGAKLFGECKREFDSVCTDSREAMAGTLFVAIKGERTDGHKYIKNVIEGGCSAVLCEYIPDEVKESDCSFALVENSVAALSAIGKYYKSLIPHKTVAITGSVGKTTTKEYVSSVLSEKYRVYKTDGNYNSTIGMPLSMLEFDENTEYAVLEMGMSGFGEIECMSRSAEPDIALITNIGTSHLEYLLTRENIAKAKCEIISGLSEDGLLIVNGDEPLLDSASELHKNILRVGIENEKNDCRAYNIRESAGGTLFDVKYNGEIFADVKISAKGKHNVYAALFAIATGIASGMKVDDVRRGLLSFSTVGMRQNIYSLRDKTIIEDCYNASPESMKAAADVLISLAREKGGRAVALLGDMLELGAESERLHTEVGEYFARAGVCALYSFGERAEKIADGAMSAGLLEECIYRNRDLGAPEVSGRQILDTCRENDVILFKASRSVAAERIIDYIKQN